MTSSVTTPAWPRIETARLRPNPWNTNVVSPENEAKLEVSMKRFGCYKPIVVRELSDGTFQILGGEHRWRTAQKLGYETVPYVSVGRIDDQKAKEIGLVDNGRYGEDDALQLAELLNGMDNLDDMLSFLPYADNDFAAIFSTADIDLDGLDIPDDDKIPELPTKAAVQTHQVMRFKVPIDDAEAVQRTIERTMKTQGYTDDDSLTNAGLALVHLLKDH